MALNSFENERPKITQSFFFLVFQGWSDCMLYEADDGDDETFERRMGNDEDRVLRHRLSANGYAFLKRTVPTVWCAPFPVAASPLTPLRAATATRKVISITRGHQKGHSTQSSRSI